MNLDSGLKDPWVLISVAIDINSIHTDIGMFWGLNTLFWSLLFRDEY
ncbi:hypothetical protein [Candidatus Liberibacter africanus]|nr:hypothetical protein [Candidatus Liberibacter africanus]